MRDPLLDALVGLFDEIDPPPDVPLIRPTGFAPMALEPVRGTAQQLSFHHGPVRMHLQVDGTHLTGLVPAGATVRVQQPDSVREYESSDGWFSAEIVPGPLCVSLPELGVTTGWFVA